MTVATQIQRLDQCNNEFKALSVESRKKSKIYRLINYISRTITFSVLAIFIFQAHFEINNMVLSVMASIEAFNNVLVQYLGLQHRGIYFYQIYNKTKSYINRFEYILQQLRTYQEYISTHLDLSESQAPPEYTDEQIYLECQSFYKELGDLKIAAFTGDSFEKITSIYNQN